MGDPCSKETNDKVMERIRKEFVATPTVEELEAEIERLEAKVKDAFESGYYSGATNQIDEDSAWEFYSGGSND